MLWMGPLLPSVFPLLVAHLFFFKFFFFLMWTIFKGFIEFVAILLQFYFLFFFGHEACGILAPQPGIKPTSPAL